LELLNQAESEEDMKYIYGNINQTMLPILKQVKKEYKNTKYKNDNKVKKEYKNTEYKSDSLTQEKKLTLENKIKKIKYSVSIFTEWINEEA
jgi:hypothetical protein